MAGAEAGFFSRLVDERLVFPDLAGATLEEALREMSSGLARAGVVRNPEDLERHLIERESMGSTGLGGGLAIPHCKVRDLADVVLSVGVSRSGIDFRAADGIPVTLIFLVVSPADAPALHLQALARLSRVIRIPGVPESLRSASTAREIAEALRAAERQLAVPA
jgi:mannitol/fructose-specific phosphotransferase system IIA component (Ntr-type)